MIVAENIRSITRSTFQDPFPVGFKGAFKSTSRESSQAIRQGSSAKNNVANTKKGYEIANADEKSRRVNITVVAIVRISNETEKRQTEDNATKQTTDSISTKQSRKRGIIRKMSSDVNISPGFPVGIRNAVKRCQSEESKVSREDKTVVDISKDSGKSINNCDMTDGIRLKTTNKERRPSNQSEKISRSTAIIKDTVKQNPKSLKTNLPRRKTKPIQSFSGHPVGFSGAFRGNYSLIKIQNKIDDDDIISKEEKMRKPSYPPFIEGIHEEQSNARSFSLTVKRDQQILRTASQQMRIEKPKQSVKESVSVKELKRKAKNKAYPPTLLNMGLNCYLNTAIQGLSSVDAFVQGFDFLKPIQSLVNVHMLNRLMHGMNNRTLLPLSLSKKSIFKGWNKEGEQDVFELLSHVVNTVFDEIRKYLVESGKLQPSSQAWIEYKLPMKIIFLRDILCSCGKTYLFSNQTDIALHVTIPKRNDKVHPLTNLLDRYFSYEDLIDYLCDSKICYGGKAKCRVKLKLPLSSVLCIHLQETFSNGQKTEKLNTKVLFQMKLVIKSEYCENSNKHHHFTLKSVIVHFGEMNKGHYVCYRFYKNNWFLLNDAKVTLVTEKDVLNCDPYVLFYEQDQMSIESEV